MAESRIVITGMGVYTPLGQSLATFHDNLLAGKSGISPWTFVDPASVPSKIGGQLNPDFKADLARYKEILPEAKFKHLRHIFKRAPLSAKSALVSALDAWHHAGLTTAAPGAEDPFDVSCILGGHNFNQRYVGENEQRFAEEPEYIEPLYALAGLDTYIAAAIADILGIRGPTYTIGGACASTNLALRDAIREIKYDDGKVSVVAGAVFDFGLLDLQAMCMIEAIAHKHFNDEPAKASRPYDTKREGFLPTQGCGTFVVESLDHALARGATIYAEVLGVEANCDANHLPNPSADGQAALIRRLLRKTGLAPEQIDYISAHATSTPMGDLEELKAIQQVFGDHASRVKINASKSMLGHCCWAAPVVESIAGILQMNHGVLHPSINIDTLDPEVKLDVCADGPVEHEVTHFLKNSFGFSGINCCAIFRRYDGQGSVPRGWKPEPAVAGA